MARRTKIVATLGPASDSPEALDSLIRAGTDVVRLNLSHGALDEHVERAARVRAAAERAGRTVAVLADLPGPKVRCGPFGDRGVHLGTASTVDLLTGEGPSDEGVVHVDYPTLLDDVVAGDIVMIGDGGITLEIEDVSSTGARATVVTGGRATGRPGFHLPASRLRLSTPTDEDLQLVAAVTSPEVDVDFVAVSFVRAAADLKAVRDASLSRQVQIVAKIETSPALADLPAIIDAADAVMVARGDLGIEVPLEEVPHIQKALIRSCVAAGVPVITATQMLETMINSPTPTRAEVSDVANAVFDGTDAVMLSGETAIGHDPALAVATMARIAERAEADADYSQWANLLSKHQRRGVIQHPTEITRALTNAAWHAAHDVDAAAILCHTRSGLTARAMARFRPMQKVVGFSPNPHTVRSLALVWGVVPRLVQRSRGTDEMIWLVVEAAVAAGDVVSGDTVAVLARSEDSPDDSTDVLRVVRIG